MIDVKISRNSGGVIRSFTVSGHSGYAEEGSDIICAAVSAMAGLVIHIAADIYKDGGKIYQDEKDAVLGFYPEKAESSVLVGGLYDELAALSEEYPENVSVRRF